MRWSVKEIEVASENRYQDRISNVLVVEERDWSRGQRRVRATWTFGGTAGPRKFDEWATERSEPVALEILEDRWSGIMGHGDPTKLLLRLDRVLAEIFEGVTRAGTVDERERWYIEDGQVVPLSEVLSVDELERVIKDWIMERAPRVAQR